MGGSGSNIPLAADKAYFGTPTSVIKFNGTGPNPDRQEASHPHQVVEYGNEYLVPDLVRRAVCMRGTLEHGDVIVGCRSNSHEG